MERLNPTSESIIICVDELRQGEFPMISEHLPELVLMRTTWYPAYGCAVVVENSEYVHLSILKLVMLDGWEVMRTCRTGWFEQTAAAKGNSKVLFLGQVAAIMLAEIHCKVNLALNKEQSFTDSTRSARLGQGHQKTPAFIECLYREAMMQGVGSEVAHLKALLPYGGTTDCGMHTGGKPRCTPWDLVWAVLEEFFQDDDMIRFSKLDYYLKCADVSISYGDADDVMEMINKSVPIILELISGHDISIYVLRIRRFREMLDSVQLMESKASADLFVLSKSIPCVPVLEIPTSQKQPCLGDESKDCRAAALIAIGAVDRIPNIDVKRFTHILAWAKLHPDKYLAQAHIEDVFLTASASLVETTPFFSFFHELKALVELKDYYKTLATPRGLDLTCEVKSRRLLAEWICCCLVHKYCVELYPAVGQYRLPLNAGSLCVTVIKNKHQEDALLAVAAYIDAVNADRELQLFNLSESEGTLQYARAHARNCQFMNARMQLEKKRVDALRCKYWKEVLEKKKRASELRMTHDRLEDELETATLEVEATRQ